jgi:hypothetical protein
VSPEGRDGPVAPVDRATGGGPGDGTRAGQETPREERVRELRRWIRVLEATIRDHESAIVHESQRLEDHRERLVADRRRLQDYVSELTALTGWR